MDNREFIGKMVDVVMDRPLGSRHPERGFLYELNYGYLPGVISGDGEELDAYILGVDVPLEKFTGRVIAVVHRLDEDDDKLVVVRDGQDYSKEEIEKLTYFQEQGRRHIIWGKE